MPIFPSDFVYYYCRDIKCSCQQLNPHRGRVFAVALDYSSAAILYGAVSLDVQRVIAVARAASQFPHSSQQPSQPFSPYDLVIIEDSIDRVLEADIVAQITNILIDRNFENGIHSSYQYTSDRDHLLVRWVANQQNCTLRPAFMLHPIKAELELECFGRKHFMDHLGIKTISLPLLCFIDGFGLFRNMYRCLDGCYVTLASMDLRQRSRRANVFPLTLGPHGSDFGEVFTSMAGLTQLDGGIVLTINGEKVFVIAYIYIFTGDMPAQNKAGGFKSQVANYGCRSCLISASERGDLDFDVVRMGRYHHHMIQLRSLAKTMTKNSKRYKDFCAEWGFSENPSALIDVTPALDIIRSRPADPAHSEFYGLAKQSQKILIEAVLSPTGRITYAQELRSFPFPPG